eukprot:CAMPEP_0194396522 /NCGR_PEP_ID=MMETSP0174-20130528/125039_1 /TAXON_ID=216777 /ORGANISM="Proboscia alata, Strain PI-D3" /LENGTH=772 /DNA_ID=CAMNT_0039192605 /DNA_START=264 /DNA_END=2579 /DNA_ORIENTATION=-
MSMPLLRILACIITYGTTTTGTFLMTSMRDPDDETILVTSTVTIMSGRSRSSSHEHEHATPSNTCLHNYVRHNNSRDFFDDEYARRPRRDNPNDHVNGHVNGHDYERVTSPNDNDNDVDVDVDAVNTLLSDRLHARKTGDFDTADRIRDRLSAEHRVTVYDKDKVWEVTNDKEEERADDDNTTAVREEVAGVVVRMRAAEAVARVIDASATEPSANAARLARTDTTGSHTALTRRGGHRVTIYDKVWEVTHRQGGGAGGRRQHNGREGGRGRGGEGVNGGRGRDGVSDRAQRKRETFGPHGHDYTLSREAGPSVVQIPEGEIHAKIAERLMAKMNRDVETDDRIQLILSEEGVYIDDRRKVWRADGVRFVDVSEGRRFRDPQQQAPIHTGPNRPYVQSEFSTPFLTQHEERFDAIQALVQARAAMKVERRYSEADATRDTLQQDFNVVCDDRIREWSMGGSFGHRNDLKRAQDTAIQSRNYSRSQFSDDLQLADISIDDLQAKVNQRTRAKSERRYAESDALREDLKVNFNVVIHDKIKMWSIGGNFGTDDPHKAKEIARQQYVRTGGEYLTDAQLVDINDTLLERISAKKRRDFVTSDKLRAYLYETYNIFINDDEREWRVLAPELPVGGFVQSDPEPGATRLSPDEVATVENLLVERINCQKQRAFDTADDLKEYLARTYSVWIDDKAREWKVVVRSSNSDSKESPSRDSNPERSRSNGSVNSRQIFGASRENKTRNKDETVATVDVVVDAGSIDETAIATKSETKAVES